MSLDTRKLDHIKICLEGKVSPFSNFLDHYQLPFQTLPEINYADIDTSVTFFWKKLSFPFIIGSMTGGPEKGKAINEHLARAAEQAKVALGLWSMRSVLEHPETLPTFNVRHLCPSIPLFANIGLVQLNYGVGADEINRLIDSVQADGIFFHCNALQEVVQPEGDTNFANLLSKLKHILPQLHAPAIIKEVGNGMDAQTAQHLKDIGVQRIDVSGLWGTSRPAVEGYRRDDNLADSIKTLGIPTDQSLSQCKKLSWLDLIAGGGIRSGIDIAKAIMLGASLWTSASPFLEPALQSDEAVYQKLLLRGKEFQIALFSTGSKDMTSFQANFPRHCEEAFLDEAIHPHRHCEPFSEAIHKHQRSNP